MPRASAPLLAFSWGYEGWGNHTRHLIASVDAVERTRGFAPPLFVDIRVRRSVRAFGFRDRAFEEQLGPARYRWMRGLGNRAIVEDLEDDIVIDRPADADALLDEIVTAANRRVIFFCSCNSPLRAAQCHRAEVARLVLARARARKVALTIHEWPGGSPLTTELALPDKDLRKARAKQLVQLAVPPDIDIAWAAALPHFSLIASDDLALVSGAARFTARGWMLPVYDVATRDKLRALQRELANDLVEENLAPRGARIELPERWRVVSPILDAAH